MTKIDFKYHIITFGCQMNKSDSERIAGFFNSLGWVEADAPDAADLVLLNTCSVRQASENRVFGQVHNLATLKKTKPNFLIAVTGCMAGRDKKGEIRKKMPQVDLFFPIIDLVRLPQMIKQIKESVPFNPIECSTDYLTITPEYSKKFQAFVPIQTGCNNFCTYCVVPFSRDRERNRPVKDILEEIKKLVAGGCVEVTLLGQTVNNFKALDPESYSVNNPFKNSFAALLWELNEILGLERINFTAADPQYMDDEVIAALALPKLVNYLHLPVQAGSNNVLASMNRKYTREKYLEIIEKIKKTRPGIALGTDIIVGFPGETDKDFEETLDLYKQVDFDISYTAKYSPRTGTAAFKMKDDVSRTEKERRWWALQNIMEETALRKNQEFKGQTLNVLFESCKDGLCSGHSHELKLVQVEDGKDWTGKIIKVQIIDPEMWVLRGKIVN